MTRLSITQTVFGAALALAIACSTAAAPAFAETPKIDIVPSKPPIRRDLGPLPQPKPESSTVTFSPDVRVNYLSKSISGGGTVTYRYRVQNVGAASANNIGLDTRVYQLSVPTFPPSDSVATVQSGNGGTIASLSQDEVHEVTIVCKPLAGNFCDGARLNAVVADDLDPSNNVAVGE